MKNLTKRNFQKNYILEEKYIKRAKTTHYYYNKQKEIKKLTKFIKTISYLCI